MPPQRNLSAAVRALIAAILPEGARKNAHAVIAAALRESAAGWNTGDLRRFIAIYAQHTDTTYISDNRLIRGFTAICDTFAARFQRPADMGELSLELLELRPLGPRDLLAIGRYRLAYAQDSHDQDASSGVSGLTSLVFRHDGRQWRVIADHTS